MQGRARPFNNWTLIIIAVFGIYAVFLIAPLFTLLFESIVDQTTGEYTLDYFKKFFGHRFYYGPIFNSLKISITVSLLTIVFATPLAYFMTMYNVRGKNALRVLLLISSMQAPFIGAYSWILLLGRNGVLTNFFRSALGITTPDIYGFSGIILVFTLQLTPLMFIFLSGAMSKMDASLLEVSDLMGFTGLRRVSRVVLPLVLPTLLAGSLLVFMRAFADFGTPMLIGEGYRTVPVLVFNEFIGELGGDTGFAAAISVSVIIFASVIFLLQKYVSSKSSFTMSALNPIVPKDEKGIKNFFIHLYVYGFTAVALLPHLYVAYTSFQRTTGRVFVPGYSLQSYEVAFSRAGRAITNTFTLGGVAIAIVFLLAILVGYVTVRRRSVATNVLDVVTMFPYLVPGSILGIALLLRFNNPPLLLSGTATIIIVSFVIRRLPFSIRSSAAIMHQISVNTEEAATSLGASNMKTFFQITLPQMLPGVLSGAILSWITIVSELSASVLLYTSRTETMTIRIYTEVIRGNFGIAAALSTILYVTTIISLLLFFRLSDSPEMEL